MKRWIVGSVFLVLLSMPGLGKAQDEEGPVTTLEEVVVTASRVEEKKILPLRLMLSIYLPNWPFTGMRRLILRVAKNFF